MPIPSANPVFVVKIGLVQWKANYLLSAAIEFETPVRVGFRKYFEFYD